MNRSRRQNTWGLRSPLAAWAPERFPAFTLEMTDYRQAEGPGNVSSTDYRLLVSDGEVSVEIDCSNSSGVSRFEFRGRKYEFQVREDDDGIASQYP